MSVILIESKEEDTLRRVNPHDVGLSGMEALSFDYVVKWPISLVISRKKIVHYQLLFRFLFYTKHIERIINNVWRSSAQLSKVQSINFYSLIYLNLFSNMDAIQCITKRLFYDIKCCILF